MSDVRLEIKFNHPQAKQPYKSRDTDIGYDIYSVDDVVLMPGVSTKINTGIAISAPPGYYYTIEGRSSFWSRNIVIPNRGIIDPTFCGDLIVILRNQSEEPYSINVGDRIAQLIIHKQYSAVFSHVDSFSFEYNQRGLAGFGSTGLK